MFLKKYKMKNGENCRSGEVYHLIVWSVFIYNLISKLKASVAYYESCDVNNLSHARKSLVLFQSKIVT